MERFFCPKYVSVRLFSSHPRQQLVEQRSILPTKRPHCVLTSSLLPVGCTTPETCCVDTFAMDVSFLIEYWGCRVGIPLTDGNTGLCWQ